jgi:hypothetical protein
MSIDSITTSSTARARELWQGATDALREHPLLAVSAATIVGAALGAATDRRSPGPTRRSSRLAPKVVSILGAAALRYGIQTAIGKLAARVRDRAAEQGAARDART